MLSSRLMLILAQAILVIGAVSMVPASIRLFSRSVDLGMPSWYLYWIIPLAMAVGAFKATVVMRKRMRNNIARLRAATSKLWPWQIYPPQLLIFIVAMVVGMAVLKRVLVDDAVGMATLGGVDVAVSVALVVASGEYRK